MERASPPERRARRARCVDHRHGQSEEREQIVKNYSGNKSAPKPRARKPEMEAEPTTPAGMRRDMAKDKAMMKDMKAPWQKGSKY